MTESDEHAFARTIIGSATIKSDVRKDGILKDRAATLSIRLPCQITPSVGDKIVKYINELLGKNGFALMDYDKTFAMVHTISRDGIDSGSPDPVVGSQISLLVGPQDRNIESVLRKMSTIFKDAFDKDVSVANNGGRFFDEARRMKNEVGECVSSVDSMAPPTPYAKAERTSTNQPRNA